MEEKVGSFEGFVSGCMMIITFHSLLFIGAFLFFEKHLYRDYEVKRLHIQYLFAITFTVCVSMLQLLLLELLHVLNSTLRRLVWQIDLVVVLILLYLIIPITFVHTILDPDIDLLTIPGHERTLLALSTSFSSTKKKRKFSFVILCFIILPLLWYVFYKSGSIMQIKVHSYSFKIMTEHMLACMGVCGVTVVAALAGFGSINYPYRNVTTFFTPVSHDQMAEVERRLIHTLNLIAEKKKNWKLLQRNLHPTIPITNPGGGSGAGRANVSNFHDLHAYKRPQQHWPAPSDSLYTHHHHRLGNTRGEGRSGGELGGIKNGVYISDSESAYSAKWEGRSLFPSHDRNNCFENQYHGGRGGKCFRSKSSFSEPQHAIMNDDNVNKDILISGGGEGEEVGGKANDRLFDNNHVFLFSRMNNNNNSNITLPIQLPSSSLSNSSSSSTMNSLSSSSSNTSSSLQNILSVGRVIFRGISLITHKIISLNTNIYKYFSNRHIGRESLILQTEIKALENLSCELFICLDELVQSRTRVLFSRTYCGRLHNIIGWCMTGVCIYRVIMSTFNVLTSRVSQIDPATKTLGIIFELLRVPIDISFWAPYASLLLMGWIIALNIRGFIEKLLAVFRYLSTSVSFNIFALLMSEIMGLYFSACAILMRIYLPEKYREHVTEVFGTSINFSAFHLHFDLIFVLSCISSFILIIFSHTHKYDKFKCM